MLKRLFPLIIIVILVLVFFYKLAFTEFILARGDTYVYFYPYWAARDAALAQGDLPLWTPNLFMGAPLLANPQVGTLYPPNWLTIPLNAPDSVRISILLHVCWAFLGAYLLARRTAKLETLAALVTGMAFAFGGTISAHVEQINQLQGLAWFPWLFLLFDRAMQKPRLFLPLFGIAWAMQILSGHTQTVFIAGVGLVLYAIFALTPLSPVQRIGAGMGNRRLVRGGDIFPRFLYLAIGAIIAVILALPQLIPTQELISLSNRGDGLNAQEATAFSLNPFLAGRGLLPSYDAQPFSEYIGYIGVVGIGLAVIGAFSGDRRRWVWLALLAAGLFLAFGRHNPLYWPLASAPGFNLFRVPARWLALAALGAAMLTGLGVQALIRGVRPKSSLPLLVAVGLVALLIGLSLLSDRAADEVDGSALPTVPTFIGWGAALGAFVAVYFLWQRGVLKAGRVGLILALLIGVELWAASQTLPYNDVTDPAVFEDPRFAINQLRVYAEDTTPPGRLLSISGLLFDPGDRAALEARWAGMPITERAARYAFTATKIQETLSGNLPLTWDVASVDGFGGGVLPTAHYTAFTSLLLPEGTLRTVDGRLREVLAQPACRGACIPADHWLDLINVRYLLTDKVYDLVHEGIFYDTQLPLLLAAGESVTLANPLAFEADAVHFLITCPAESGCISGVTLEGSLPLPKRLGRGLRGGDREITLDGLKLVEFITDSPTTPSALTLTAAADMTLYATSLVDTRTGDFVQLAPPGWQRVYSADVKIYENLDVMPRAFVVHQALTVPDTWQGTEDALALMRDPAFDPRQTVVLNTSAALTSGSRGQGAEGVRATATITAYTPTRVEITVNSPATGYLVLTDAYYPGWEGRVYVGDALVSEGVYRAAVMFRAVAVPEGESRVVFEFQWP